MIKFKVSGLGSVGSRFSWVQEVSGFRVEWNPIEKPGRFVSKFPTQPPHPQDPNKRLVDEGLDPKP